jgi:glutaredoxin
MNGILLTTTTCPKCPAMKAWVSDNIKFDVRIVDETAPDFGDLLRKYGVTAAPTLIIEKDGKELFRGNEDYEVEEFLKNF